MIIEESTVLIFLFIYIGVKLLLGAAYLTRKSLTVSGTILRHPRLNIEKDGTHSGSVATTGERDN